MNQAVNLFWTILCFIPVIAFWVGHYSVLWLCGFIFISVISQVLPAAKLQLSSNPKFYEKLGVKFVRRFVQNGDHINKFIRKGDASQRVIKNKAKAAAYMSTVVMYERFHLICLLFFMLTAGLAIVRHQYILGLTIVISNIIYNVYPILLQQYNRARIARIGK